MSRESALLTSIVGVIDAVVELYLHSVIKPFLTLHEEFYSKLNTVLRAQLDRNEKNIPDWFTANFITYARTWVVIPTLMLMAWGHLMIPSFLVIFVDFGDFLDGVVARFWVDVKKEQLEVLASKDKPSRSPSPSDDDSYGTYRNEILVWLDIVWVISLPDLFIVYFRGRFNGISSQSYPMGCRSSMPHLRRLH